MPNVFSDQATRKIVDHVRRGDREPRDLTRGPEDRSSIGYELCMFEMTDQLRLPQNGPGTATAKKLAWDSSVSHIGMLYDNLFNNEIEAQSWYGDVTDRIRPYDPEGEDELIFLLDALRKYSKMATSDGDVGAYGLAWKPHDGSVVWKGMGAIHTYDPTRRWSPPLPVWFIATMQTPGDFFGTIKDAGGLTFAAAGCTVTAFAPSGSGHKALSGYDVFGENHGNDIYVKNVPSTNEYGGAYVHAGNQGDVVLCRWNARDGGYRIVWVEGNNKGWSTQTVITSVSIDGGGHVTGLTSEDFQYPPWAPPL